MKKIEILPNGRKRVYTVNDEPSKTDQSFAPQTDVNNIMSHYIKTGQMKHLRNAQGHFADLSEIPDLLQATLQVEQASKAFQALPSQLRTRFNHNPVELVNFLSDPANYNEAVTLGIYPAKELNSEPTLTTQKRKPQPKGKNDDNSNDDE